MYVGIYALSRYVYRYACMLVSRYSGMLVSMYAGMSVCMHGWMDISEEAVLENNTPTMATQNSWDVEKLQVSK